jgi:hypothetical protein
MSYFLVILGLAVIAYTAKFTPGDFDEMSIYMDYARQGHASVVFQHYALNPLSAFILYAVAITGNYPILRVLSVIISYGLILYSIHIISVKRSYKHSTELILAGILFSIYPFWNIADNIRYPIAIGIITVGIVRQLYTKSNSIVNYVLIIIAPMVHIGTLLFAILFIISNFRRIARFLAPLLLIVQIIALPLLVRIQAYLPEDLSSILTQKSDAYFIQGSSYRQWISVPLYMLSFLLLIFECYTVFLTFKRKNRDSIARVGFIQEKSFFTLLSSFLLGCIVNTQFIRRFGLYGFPCFFPQIGDNLEKLETKDRGVPIYLCWIGGIIFGYTIYNLRGLLGIWW